MLPLDAEKKLAAEAAAEHVRDGMMIGLGTGSTAAYAALKIGQRVKDGLRITATSSSLATEQLARSVNIPLVDFSGVSHLDLTIDGADEIDPQLQAVKGGGGALFREKILAAASNTMICIADSSKLVEALGKAKVPVEVLPFAASFVERELGRLCDRVVVRQSASGVRFVTDQGNYIFDMFFQQPYAPAPLAAWLKAVPGVIEHGLFLAEIDMLIVAKGENVSITIRPDRS
jgi:ribose 5-phosphate isomerase A